MTLPRPVYPGDTLLNTRRCYRGEARLRPDREVVQAYLYCIAIAVQHSGTRLHDFQAPSNHDHVLNTDPLGVQPRFAQIFHSLLARALNTHFNDRDALWSGKGNQTLRLPTVEDILEYNIYVLTNVVKHGRVRYAKDWLGPNSWNMEYGVPVLVKKPDFFFSDDMPDEVELVIHRPPGLFPELSDREARAELRRRALEHQRKLIDTAKEEGRTFRGWKRACRVSRNKPLNPFIEHRALRPTVAAKDPELRDAMLRELVEFRAKHEAARIAFKNGRRDVEFPFGTYQMLHELRARIEPSCSVLDLIRGPPDHPSAAQ